MRLSLPLKYLCESKTVVYENRRVYEDRNYGNQCMRIEASPSTGQNRFPLLPVRKKTCFRWRHGPWPWPLSNRPFLLFKADFPTMVQIWPGLVLKSLWSEPALLEEIIRGLPLERAAMLILFNAGAIKSPLALNEAQIER